VVDLKPSYADVMDRLTDIARLDMHKSKTTKLPSKSVIPRLTPVLWKTRSWAS